MTRDLIYLTSRGTVLDQRRRDSIAAMSQGHSRHSEAEWRQHCEGAKCHQGRVPCDEMACWAPIDEDALFSFGLRLAVVFVVGLAVLACWLPVWWP